MGCLMGHINALETFLASKLDAVCIFEDDAELCVDFKGKLAHFIETCPFEIDALWFNGYEAQKPVKIADNIYKVMKQWGAFGYLVTRHFAAEMLPILKRLDRSVDGTYSHNQHRFNVFRAKEPLVYHRLGYSTIQEREVQYHNLAK